MNETTNSTVLKRSIVVANARLISAFDRLNARALMRASATQSVLPVVEYPKSGGTWVAKMISVAVGVPYLDDCVGFVRRPCTIRTHWRPSLRYERAVYVLRDIRDIFISLFYHRERNARKNPALAKRYVKLFGEPISVEKFNEQISTFIAYEMSGWGGGVAHSWNDHVQLSLSCCQANKQVSLVKYENILSDTPLELQRIVREVYGVEISKERACLVSDLFKPKNQVINQNSGEKTFFRSGVSGEWRNALPRDAAKQVAEAYNSSLALMSYETNSYWWKEL